MDAVARTKTRHRHAGTGGTRHRRNGCRQTFPARLLRFRRRRRLAKTKPTVAHHHDRGPLCPGQAGQGTWPRYEDVAGAGTPGGDGNAAKDETGSRHTPRPHQDDRQRGLPTCDANNSASIN